MATAEQIAWVRRKAGEPGTETYTDEALSALIDAEGSVEAATAAVWQEKAASVAELVNTSESGSSRSMQQIHQNYLRMAEHYSNKVETVVEAADGPFTTDIERV